MAAAPAPPSTWSPWQKQAWTIINSSSAPVIMLMVLAPGWSGTRWVVDRVAPLHMALGTAYGVFLARGVLSGGPKADFRDGESMARALSSPDGALAGWTHYITFDLFVATWIWRTAQAHGVGARLEVLLAWLAGPVGLTIFLARRPELRPQGRRQA